MLWGFSFDNKLQITRMKRIYDDIKGMKRFLDVATDGNNLAAAMRHCERSEAIQSISFRKAISLDCFVPRNDAKRRGAKRRRSLVRQARPVGAIPY